MGFPAQPESALLVIAAFSRYPHALQWAVAQTSARWGVPQLVSEPLPFIETDYYLPSMGPDLCVQLAAYQQIEQDLLAGIKLLTNSLEVQYAAAHPCPEPRPLNLDPGYLTAGKFILATTKDALQRIYLGQGIFAEVTLHYSHGAWQESEWTYPNYRRDDHKAFLMECRKRCLAALRQKVVGEH